MLFQEMVQVLLTPQQVKERYGLHPNTLLLWEKQGLPKPIRTPGGRHRYFRQDIERLLGLGHGPLEGRKPEAILYARVSTKRQEEHLKDQAARLEAWAKERGERYEAIAEVASGVDEERRGLRKVLNRARTGKLRAVVRTAWPASARSTSRPTQRPLG